MNAGKSAIVVGAGVIGSACAYYLSRAGWSVTIVDGAGFGAGCSHANCGFVSPSHVLPLAGPGAAWDALRMMLRHDAPLRITPRLDPALWKWLFRFARRCNEADMLAAARAITALLNSSRRLYDELMRDEPFDCEWMTRGMLFVFRTRRAFEHFAHTDHLLRTRFDMPAERLGEQETLALEPALKPGIAGAWHYRGDAHLRPDRLMASWRRVLERRGVAFRQAQVASIRREGGRARALRTTTGELTADSFIFATGALTPRLSQELRCTIPIQPGKGFSMTMPRPARCPAIPLIFEEDRVAVTPMQSGFRLGSMMEFAGYDATLPPSRFRYLLKTAERYLHDPHTTPIQERWCGWRPMTYDSVPLIGRTPPENVWLAAGHNMLGVSMSPATGRLVAEMVTGQTPHLDPRPYRVERFA